MSFVRIVWQNCLCADLRRGLEGSWDGRIWERVQGVFVYVYPATRIIVSDAWIQGDFVWRRGTPEVWFA